MEQFYSVIHSNGSLFSYLQSYILQDAKATIAGLKVSGGNTVA